MLVYQKYRLHRLGNWCTVQNDEHTHMSSSYKWTRASWFWFRFLVCSWSFFSKLW